MKALYILYHMMRADFLQRVRSYRFLAMLLFTIFLTYLFVPALDVIQIVGLNLGGYRGTYNSAWIGSMVTLLMGEFFMLFAFFLVKGSIDLDRRTGVGQILAATPMSKAAYTLGKWLSNFAVIAAMTGMMVVAALGLQGLRGETATFDLWALAAPFLLVLLPALAVIAAVAVLFDCINWLRGGLGNLVFFFVAYPVLYSTLDLAGNNLIYPSIYQACAAQFTGCTLNRQIDVGLLPLLNYPAFQYAGIPWTAELLVGRLALVLVGALIALLAAVFFHRFDPAKSEQNFVGDFFAALKRFITAPALPPATSPELVEVAAIPAVAPAPPTAHLPPLPTGARLRLGHPQAYWHLLVAEWRLTFNGVSWLWYLGALGIIGAALFLPDLSSADFPLTPVDVAHYVLLPLAWLWPLTLWSGLGAREVRARAEALVLAGPYPLRRHLPMVWLVGVLIALVMSSGVGVQLALAGRWAALAAVGVGAFFVPTLALALGCWSSGNKLFEGAYLFFWYMAAVHGVPHLDFMGRVPLALAAGMPWVYAGLTVVLLGLAVLGRQRQIKV